MLGPLRSSLLASPSFYFTRIGEWRMQSGPLGTCSGLSFLGFSYSACSGAPSPGLPLSLSLSSGLLRAPLAGSGPLLPLSFFFYA